MRRRRKLKRWNQQAGKYRLKRRSGSLFREVGVSLLLLGIIVMMNATFIYGFALLFSSPLLATRHIIVRGCNELTEKEVLQLAQIHEGVNILALNTKAIADRVKRNPWVKEVTLGREYPDRIVIELKERVALALVKEGEQLYLVDQEGVVFKPFSEDDNVDLPILTGFSVGKGCNDRLFHEAVKLLDLMRSKAFITPPETLAEIHGDPRVGISLITTTGMCLFLGQDNFEGKLSRLSLIVADLERRELRANYVRIDLSDPTKVIVQPTNVPIRRGITPVGEQLRSEWKRGIACVEKLTLSLD